MNASSATTNALVKLLRSTGNGAELSFSSTGDKTGMWLNEDIERQDTMATCEIRNMGPDHFHSFSTAALRIEVCPGRYGCDFPALCLVGLATNLQHRGDMAAHDVVVKEWHLHPAAADGSCQLTLPLRLIYNITTVLTDEPFGERLRLFLTLRFLGSTDGSVRHCISAVRLLYHDVHKRNHFSPASVRELTDANHATKDVSSSPDRGEGICQREADPSPPRRSGTRPRSDASASHSVDEDEEGEVVLTDAMHSSVPQLVPRNDDVDRGSLAPPSWRTILGPPVEAVIALASSPGDIPVRQPNLTTSQPLPSRYQQSSIPHGQGDAYKSAAPLLETNPKDSWRSLNLSSMPGYQGSTSQPPPVVPLEWWKKDYSNASQLSSRSRLFASSIREAPPPQRIHSSAHAKSPCVPVIQFAPRPSGWRSTSQHHQPSPLGSWSSFGMHDRVPSENWHGPAGRNASLSLQGSHIQTVRRQSGSQRRYSVPHDEKQVFVNNALKPVLQGAEARQPLQSIRTNEMPVSVIPRRSIDPSGPFPTASIKDDYWIIPNAATMQISENHQKMASPPPPPDTTVTSPECQPQLPLQAYPATRGEAAPGSPPSVPVPAPPAAVAVTLPFMSTFVVSKHHVSRCGTSSRTLMLQRLIPSSSEAPATTGEPPREGGGAVMVTLKKLGAAGLKDEGEKGCSATLQYGNAIEVLTGVVAYHSGSIHQSKVKHVECCLVLTYNGLLVTAVEFASEEEMQLAQLMLSEGKQKGE